MAIWLIRAGSHGEYELKFIQENRVYVDKLDHWMKAHATGKGGSKA
jgi:hypothetical protein